MAIFNESEFYSILRESVRLNVVVPFDCYLRLSKNNRIIRFLHKDNFPSEDTFEKLKEFEVSDIYIKNEDLDAYKNYVRQFLETGEGKKIVENLSPEQSEIKGIPQGILDDLQKIKGGTEVPEEEFFIVGHIVESDENPFDKNDSNQIKTAAQKINHQLGDLFNEKNSAGKVSWDLGGSNIVVQGRYDINEDLVKISSKMSDEIVKLALSSEGSKVIQKEDIYHIQGAMVEFFNSEIQTINTNGGDGDDGLKGRFNVMISNALQEVEKKSGKKLSDQFKSKFSSAKEKLKEDLFIVKDYSPKDTDPSKDLFIVRDHRKAAPNKQHQHFKMPDYAEENLQEQIELLLKIAQNGNTKGHQKLKSQVQNFKKNLLNAKTVIDENPDEVGFAINKDLVAQRVGLEKKAIKEDVSPSLLNFFEGLKKIYDKDESAKAFIEDQNFTTFDTPEDVSKFLNKIKFFFGDIPSQDDSSSQEEIHQLKQELAKEKERSRMAEFNLETPREKILNDIIEKQKKAITLYQSKIQDFEEREKAGELKSKDQRELPNRNQEISPENRETIKNFEESLPQPHPKNESKAQEDDQNVLNFHTGEIKAPNLPKEDDFDKDLKNLSREVKETQIALKDAQKEKEEVSNKNRQLEKENKRLKENASNMESKLQEFEEFVNSHVNYIDSIEKENQTFQTTLSDLKKNIDNEQFKNEKLEDIKRDNETILNRNDDDIKGYHNTINDLRTTVAEKEREIETLSSSVDRLERGNETEREKAKETLGKVIRDKDKQLSRLQTSVDNQRDTVRQLNKEIGMLKNHNDDTLRLKKKLGDQLADLEVQRNVFKKKEDALNSKVIMLTNLNQQTRKTITRLTVITESLRKDKLKLAADKAGNDTIKDQLNKTIITLKASARALQQKEGQANKTIEKLNQKVNELQKQFAEETKKTFDLEKKVRAYKLKAS